MDNFQENKLKEEIAKLRQKLLILESNYDEALKYSEMAIVETRADMRIINSDGAIDSIFEEGIDYFERGESLITVIYKTTHNTKPTVENDYQNYDDIDNIEETIRKFVESGLDEKSIRIIGEKESGEIFLLLWKIRRKDKTFKSFFRIIPSNAIVQSTRKKHVQEIESMQKIIKDTLNLVEEGVVVLNLKNEIQYMNNAAKRFFFNENTNLLKKAPVEGRYFQEIFVNEPSDDIRLRIEAIANSVQNKIPQAYNRKKGDSEILFKVYPFYNEKKECAGTITIIKDDIDIFSSNYNQKEEIERMSKALKHYSSIAKKSEIRLVELENNQKWLMKQNSELQSGIRSIYAFMENLPTPVVILQLPSRKYEFANKALLAKFGWSKEHIKNKTDDDLFSGENADIISSKNSEVIETKEIVKVSASGFYAKQSVLVNTNNQPTHIIRVFV